MFRKKPQQIKSLFVLTFLCLLFVIFADCKARAAEIEVIMPQRTGVNQPFPVKVLVNTQGKKTIGTDLLIAVDFSELEFVQAEPSGFYPNYHQPKIHLNLNQLRFSGTSNYLDYKAGSGELVTLFFKKKIVGQPKFEIIWEKGATDDTNVIGLNGDDLLVNQPLLRYDNSLRKKPSSQDALTGDVLGHQILSDNLLASQLSQSLSASETLTSKKNSSLSSKIIFLIVIIVILLLFIKRRDQKRKLPK